MVWFEKTLVCLSVSLPKAFYSEMVAPIDTEFDGQIKFTKSHACNEWRASV